MDEIKYRKVYNFYIHGQTST